METVDTVWLPGDAKRLQANAEAEAEADGIFNCWQPLGLQSRRDRVARYKIEVTAVMLSLRKSTAELGISNYKELPIESRFFDDSNA